MTDREAPRPDDDERFLAEAVARRLLTAAQAEEARGLRRALGEVDVALTLDEILARKGFLARERSAELRRALARQRVGRYEVIERLGEGGSGVVWKARDVTLDRLVALKLLHREAREDPAWRERFLREARTAVTLNHVGLVRGLDCGEADGYLYFAMEYVPGESVAARLRREGRIAEKDAFRIAADVVRVLRYVASLGIVHRDLKPDNLVLTPDGRTKVCDLGLAKPTREEAERAGADTTIAGTPLYVAPEQIRDGDRVDWRADVYALGATLYHMVAGRPPFPAERGKDLLHRHLHEVPPSPREFALDVTPNAAAVVLKMLQKDPADRYARLEDLEADLDAVLAGRAPLHTISFAPRERPSVDAASARAAASPARRGSRWAAAAAALLALAAIGTAGVAVATTCTWQAVNVTARDAARQRPPVAPPREPAPSPPAATAPERGPESPLETEAYAALETARRHAADHPGDLAGELAAFRFVGERYPGTSAAAVARGVADDLAAQMERVAAEALAAAARRAAELEADGRVGEALRAFESVATSHAATRAAAAAADEVRRLRGVADRRLAELTDAARDAVAQGDFAVARARLAEVAALSLPWAETDLARLRRELASAEDEFGRAREQTRPAFERVWGTAVLDVGADGLAAALEKLDAAALELAPWRRELDALHVDLLSGRRSGEPVSAAGTPLDRRAEFFERLVARDLAGAAALVPVIAAAGGRADDLRDGVARVRAVLVARADGFLADAETARAEKRLADAERLVERAFAEVPDHPRARVAAAANLAARGRADAAAQELQRVLALPAPPPEAHLRLGQILASDRSTHDRAQREIELYFSLASEDDPFRAEARASHEALIARRTAARVAELRAELSLAADHGRPERVVAAAEALVALTSADARTLTALGDAYSELGRPHDAFLAYHRVVTEFPLDREAPRARSAVTRLEQRNVPSAADREGAAAARALLDAGDVEKARDAFDAVVRRAPFLEDALAGAAEAWLTRRGRGAYALADDPRRALRLTDVLTRRNPQHVRGLALRAESLLRTGDARGALALAVQVSENDGLRPDVRTTAGFAALALDDADAALDHFTEALRLRRSARALYGRALAHEALRRPSAARQDAETLLAEFGLPDELREEVVALLARHGLVPVEPPK